MSDPHQRKNLFDNMRGQVQKVKETLFYNNIVSGFLQTVEGGQNTGVLFREMEESAFKRPSQMPNLSALNPEEFARIKENIMRSGLQDTRDQEKSNTSFDSQTINEYLLGRHLKEQKIQTPSGNNQGANNSGSKNSGQ